MFDDFRNFLSNAHQVCCEDSPNKGLYNLCQSDDLDLHSRSQLCLILDTCLTCSLIVISQTVSYDIQTWHDGRLLQEYAHAHFDDLDLDTRSQWLGRGKK